MAVRAKPPMATTLPATSSTAATPVITPTRVPTASRDAPSGHVATTALTTNSRHGGTRRPHPDTSLLLEHATILSGDQAFALGGVLPASDRMPDPRPDQSPHP